MLKFHWCEVSENPANNKEKLKIKGVNFLKFKLVDKF